MAGSTESKPSMLRWMPKKESALNLLEVVLEAS